MPNWSFSLLTVRTWMMPSRTRSLACLGLAASFAPAALAQVPVDCNPRDKAIESCTIDASVVADYDELQRLVREQFLPFGGEGPGPAAVKISFSGRARTTTALVRSDDAEGQVDDGDPGKPGNPKTLRSDAWRLFNPASRNEFQLATPPEVRIRIHEQMQQTSRTRPTKGRTGDGGGDSPDSPGLNKEGGARGDAWSQGNDSRVRRTETTSFPWRTVADMGGCTATFIGPRHIVTAAHCLYSRKKAAWGAGFTLVPGRDVNVKPFGQTSMPPKPGQTGWYFTPAGFRLDEPDGGSSQYDFGIVVVPDRMGDTIGWMGYGTLSADTLRAGSPHLLRGYPFCESETSGATERIDEPSPCTINAFYVGESCSVADFSKLDADNWNRRVTHGCDASAANSGSSIYSYQSGFGAFVAMIHTTSLKCAFPGDPPCTAADTHPLQATRLTPEYTGWVSYFRNLFP